MNWICSIAYNCNPLSKSVANAPIYPKPVDGCSAFPEPKEEAPTMPTDFENFSADST